MDAGALARRFNTRDGKGVPIGARRNHSAELIVRDRYGVQGVPDAPSVWAIFELWPNAGLAKAAAKSEEASNTALTRIMVFVTSFISYFLLGSLISCYVIGGPNATIVRPP
jgi:hypothetical protein